MAQVRPPPGRVPKSIENVSPELYKFLVDLLVHDFQVWKRTGGGDDAIESIVSSETYETSNSAGETQDQINTLEQIEDLIPVPEVKIFEAKTTSSSYTAVNLDLVTGLHGARITLDPNAEIGAEIITHNGDGSVINVSGPIRYKGSTGSDINMRLKGTSLHWYLFEDSGEKYWLAS